MTGPLALDPTRPEIQGPGCLSTRDHRVDVHENDAAWKTND